MKNENSILYVQTSSLPEKQYSPLVLAQSAKAMGVDDLYDTAQNVMGGARFLRVLANRFDGDLVKVLSAYHAGSTRVLGRDATPFAATDDYVRKVLKIYYQLRDAGERRGAG